jgi:hypothetical protein
VLDGSFRPTDRDEYTGDPPYITSGMKRNKRRSYTGGVLAVVVRIEVGKTMNVVVIANVGTSECHP